MAYRHVETERCLDRFMVCVVANEVANHVHVSSPELIPSVLSGRRN